MIKVSFDPQDPPDEPPAEADPSYWRVAVRLLRDHSPEPAPSPSAPSPSDPSLSDPSLSDPSPAAASPSAPRPSGCRQCRQPWPCAARRLAERGVIGALRTGRRGAGPPNRGHWDGWDDAAGERGSG